MKQFSSKREQKLFPMMNETFKVASIFACNNPMEGFQGDASEPVYVQTILGCKLLLILQEMFKFNISYVDKDYIYNVTDNNETNDSSHQYLFSPDLYARPMSLRTDILNDACPIQAIYNWRFGFILRRSNGGFRSFYSEPFTRSLWNCLYAMAILVSLLFYLLKRWETRLLNKRGECSVFYELLVAVGAYCQHILPVHATLTSRRAGYWIFFMFCYLIYCIYTSRLLSVLVSEKKRDMTLEDLAGSSYDCAVLTIMKVYAEKLSPAPNMVRMRKKLSPIKYVNISAGLEGVRNGEMALLSDFTSLYHFIKDTFDDRAICELMEINVYSDIMKYFFTSKNFPYKEQFKIGTLRVKESGILRRLIAEDSFAPPPCALAASPQARMEHIIYSLTVLGSSYVLATLIMLAERMHYKRNKPFPYVD